MHERMQILQSPLLAGFPHGYTTRDGGVSAPPHDALNLGGLVGDDPARVAENWRRLERATGLGFARVKQVHGARVLRATAPGEPTEEADVVVSSAAGVAACVSVADCVPDPRRGPGDRRGRGGPRRLARHPRRRGRRGGGGARARGERAALALPRRDRTLHRPVLLRGLRGARGAVPRGAREHRRARRGAARIPAPRPLGLERGRPRARRGLAGTHRGARAVHLVRAGPLLLASPRRGPDRAPGRLHRPTRTHARGAPSLTKSQTPLHFSEL